jgi:hypothetical protein
MWSDLEPQQQARRVRQLQQLQSPDCSTTSELVKAALSIMRAARHSRNGALLRVSIGEDMT